MTPAETISPDEVARRLGLKRETVMDWARRGVLGSVTVGRKVRFTEAHVQAYIKLHERPADALVSSPRSAAYHNRH